MAACDTSTSQTTPSPKQLRLTRISRWPHPDDAATLLKEWSNPCFAMHAVQRTSTAQPTAAHAVQNWQPKIQPTRTGKQAERPSRREECTKNARRAYRTDPQDLSPSSAADRELPKRYCDQTKESPMRSSLCARTKKRNPKRNLKTAIMLLIASIPVFLFLMSIAQPAESPAYFVGQLLGAFMLASLFYTRNYSFLYMSFRNERKRRRPTRFALPFRKTKLKPKKSQQRLSETTIRFQIISSILNMPTPWSLWALYQIVSTGRADSLKEAILYFDELCHRQKMEGHRATAAKYHTANFRSNGRNQEVARLHCDNVHH